MTGFVIPPRAVFADLRLERDDAGGLHYLPEPLAAFCCANGLDVGETLGNEDLAGFVLTEWYLAHRTAGGDPDPIAEEILAEAAALQASDIPSLQEGGGREH